MTVVDKSISEQSIELFCIWFDLVWVSERRQVTKIVHRHPGKHHQSPQFSLLGLVPHWVFPEMAQHFAQLEVGLKIVVVAGERNLNQRNILQIWGYRFQNSLRTQSVIVQERHFERHPYAVVNASFHQIALKPIGLQLTLHQFCNRKRRVQHKFLLVHVVREPVEVIDEFIGAIGFVWNRNINSIAGRRLPMR